MMAHPKSGLTIVAAVLYSCGALFGQASPAAAGGDRPNVVLIVADDLGYADLGCQGSKEVRTPSIDSLAANGTRFTNGYVSCPVCSPTRAGLNTGRYQQRFGHEFNPGANGQRDDIVFGLPLTEVTLADRIKAAGYKTGMVGKWHLGSKEGYQPPDRGFDEFFGFLGGAHSYVKLDQVGPNAIMRNRGPAEEKEYLTDAFKREAVAFIDKHAKEPFFLYLTFNAVHTPLDSPPAQYLEPFAKVEDQKRRVFLAKLLAMDTAVGAVIQHLKDAGVYENTLIVFHSDNGGPTAGNTSKNDPLQGFKGQVWEGGIRIPYIIQWPKRLPKGRVDDRPVISLDIFPTAVAAIGGTLPAGKTLDGVNLLPYLTGKEQKLPHEALFWRFGQQAAIRKGDWKLIKPQGAGAWQLHNLASDVGERKDVASEHADVVKDLESAWNAWNADLAKPLWERAPAKKAGGRNPAAGGRRAARRARTQATE